MHPLSVDDVVHLSSDPRAVGTTPDLDVITDAQNHYATAVLVGRRHRFNFAAFATATLVRLRRRFSFAAFASERSAVPTAMGY